MRFDNQYILDFRNWLNDKYNFNTHNLFLLLGSILTYNNFFTESNVIVLGAAIYKQREIDNVSLQDIFNILDNFINDGEEHEIFESCHNATEIKEYLMDRHTEDILSSDKFSLN